MLTGESPEVMDKMRLIIVAAIMRNIRKATVLFTVELQCRVKSYNAGEQLGGEAGCGAKLPFKLPLGKKILCT